MTIYVKRSIHSQHEAFHDEQVIKRTPIPQTGSRA